MIKLRWDKAGRHFAIHNRIYTWQLALRLALRLALQCNNSETVLMDFIYCDARKKKEKETICFHFIRVRLLSS